MSTLDIIDNIKNETGTKLTPAQIAYELKKAAAGLTEEKIEQIKAEKPLNDEDKKKAMETIGSFLATKEAENASPIQPIDVQRRGNIATSIDNNENKLESITNDEAKPSNKIDDKKATPVLPPTDEQIKQFVIPVIADKIITNGKDGVEKNTVTYDSDNFAAMLRLGDEEQTISLDRKDASPENMRALEARKGNNQQEYQIVINNVKPEEFERFKALFEKATSKNIGELQKSDNEID